ncbi:uncharacterized protein LOC133039102 [Cannabis sativa]|uniref:uncharacterized protein LOC133039102 n=1 Tax=Cannabis sativa TaxID=3483 RepID=UPI0029C9E56D|nr:uncharacterized protein LOC133039102 [Cannabis sativa]
MEMFREGGSTSRPPMLEGANYPYWKTKMRAFLKAVDERVWMAVSEGWSPPSVTDEEGDKLKKTSEWTVDEMEKANFNSKALHALFNAVSTNQLKVISNCEVAKEAWEKLRIKNEGTEAVKKARLRALAKSFENLSMDEEESVTDFHAKLCDISNESYALGKVYSNKKLVRKVLGALPKKFMSKVTSIEESRDIEALDLDELICSLQNYEMSLKMWSKGKKQKDLEKDKSEMGVAFVLKEDTNKLNESVECSMDENFALLAKNYARFLKKSFKKSSGAGKENSSGKNQSNFNKAPQSGEEKGRGIQCHECKGFGHIQAECANTLKKKKALTVTWSDSDEEEPSDSSKDDKSMIAFLAKECSSVASELEETISDSDSDGAEKNRAYEEMFAQWSYMAKRIKELQDWNKELDASKSDLEEKLKKLTMELCSKDSEIYKLTAELFRTKQSLSCLPPGTAALNQALHSQKPYGDRTSIGYKMLYKQGQDLSINGASSSHEEIKLNFVPASENLPCSQKEISSSESLKKVNNNRRTGRKKPAPSQEKFVPVCHFCNRRGHIRPKCYKLNTYLRNLIKRQSTKGKSYNSSSGASGRKSTGKAKDVALVAHTSLSAMQENHWYFDSGCSRHMTGSRDSLSNFKDNQEGSVTFGDGNRGKIMGYGDLKLAGKFPLTGVLFVQGLKANLISIGQLCDAEYDVRFTKSQCLVSLAGSEVLVGNRTADHCYALGSQVTCHRTFMDKLDLWHYRLGHLNFRDLKRIVKLKAVRGIPELTMSRDRMCGPCQQGKQTRSSHPPINDLLTSRVLELLHVDLMGPMQTESIAGKR